MTPEPLEPETLEAKLSTADEARKAICRILAKISPHYSFYNDETWEETWAQYTDPHATKMGGPWEIISWANQIVNLTHPIIGERIEQLLAEREKDKAEIATKPRLFPIMKPKREIPWSIAEKAYAVYVTRGGSSQSMERVAQRGGFYGSEMDEFYPNWRIETDDHELIVVALKAQLAAKDKLLAMAREDTARLDFLDDMNARKNAFHGNRYGWGFSINHNRIALEDHIAPAVDVRKAIDAQMAKHALSQQDTITGSSNGRTAPFEGVNAGSSPAPVTTQQDTGSGGAGV